MSKRRPMRRSSIAGVTITPNRLPNTALNAAAAVLPEGETGHKQKNRGAPNSARKRNLSEATAALTASKQSRASKLQALGLR